MSYKDVFISYKAEEFDDADWVKSFLENNGISCWMAPMCIPGGSNYAMEIPRAIRNCKAFVLILSKRSQESKWVPRELDQAISEGKTILPFVLENCVLRDDFKFYLTNVQSYAAYENKNTAIEKMIREIIVIIGKKESSPINSVSQPSSASNKYYNEAMRFLKLKLYDKALVMFDKAIEDNYNNSEIYFYAAISLLRGKKAFLAKRIDIDKIEEYIQTALAIEPKAIYYYFWAYIKYDHFYRKSYITNPNYQEVLKMANQANLSGVDVNQLYAILGVERPSAL